jgi:hypothetical protein
MDNSGTHITGSSVSTYKSKKSGSKKKGTGVITGSSTTSIEYDVAFELNIYNDEGKNDYFYTREPFGSGIDSYHSSLNYMIKRMPYGSKHKE